MAQYLLSVWHAEDDEVYPDDETMRVKGWVRRYTASGNAALEAIDAGDTVSYSMIDSSGNEVLHGVSVFAKPGQKVAFI